MLWLVVAHIVVIFLFLTNRFLQGSKKESIASWLGWLWLGFIVAGIVNFGWRGASVTAATSLLGFILLRPVAARTAASLMSGREPGDGGSYPGAPPRELLLLSKVLGDYSALQNPSQMLAEMTSGRPSKKDLALNQLLDAVTARPDTAAVLRANGTEREDVRSAYQSLVLAGAGQWAGAHFAAASAIYYENSLRFVLSAKYAGLADMEIAYAIIEHFQSGRALPEVPRAGGGR